MTYGEYVALVAMKNAAEPDKRKHRCPLRRDLFKHLIAREAAS